MVVRIFHERAHLVPSARLGIDRDAGDIRQAEGIGRALVLHQRRRRGDADFGQIDIDDRLEQVLVRHVHDRVRFERRADAFLRALDLELPATAWLRRYRVRANGRVMQPALDRLRSGVTVAGVHYGPIEATLDREQGGNVWLTFAIREGKNREVRKVLESLELKVNRLIRVSFGPFQLGELADGEVKEIESQALRTELGEEIVGEAGADFDAPMIDHDAAFPVILRGANARRSRAGIRQTMHEPRPSFRGATRLTRVRAEGGHKQPRRDRTGGPRPKYPR